MAQFRLIYDSNNSTATIVMTEISADEVKFIGTEILKVAIEPATMLKNTGFKDEMPVIPPKAVENESEKATFADLSIRDEAKTEKQVVSAVLETNPIPEDSGINTSLLDNPVAPAPALNMSNEVQSPATTEEKNSEDELVEEYIFSFGSNKGMSTADMIAENPAKAFSYFQWALRKGILKSKTPNEDVFKRVVFRQARDFYSQFPLQENEVKDVAYVLLTSIAESDANEIIALLGYSTIEELYTSENVQCYLDAIKMAFA